MSDSTSKDLFSVSRRSFLKSFSASAAVAATAQVEAVAQQLQKANREKVYGPGTVPIMLQVNGKSLKLQVEPRVTLLEALRNHSNLTGAKEVAIAAPVAPAPCCSAIRPYTPARNWPSTRKATTSQQ